MSASVTNGERCVNITEKKTVIYIKDLCDIKYKLHIYMHARARTHRKTLKACGPRPQLSHLGLPLFQQRLQPLLGGSALVVVADDQDDVAPAEFAHQVEPHVGLVGVGRYRAQEGEVDALEDGGRTGRRQSAVIGNFTSTA